MHLMQALKMTPSQPHYLSALLRSFFVSYWEILARSTTPIRTSSTQSIHETLTPRNDERTTPTIYLCSAHHRHIKPFPNLQDVSPPRVQLSMQRIAPPLHALSRHFPHIPTVATLSAVFQTMIYQRRDVIRASLHLCFTLMPSPSFQPLTTPPCVIALVSYELAAHMCGMLASGRASILLALRQRIVQEALAKIPTLWVEGRGVEGWICTWNSKCVDFDVMLCPEI
jgi:hypothetical protein